MRFALLLIAAALAAPSSAPEFDAPWNALPTPSLSFLAAMADDRLRLVLYSSVRPQK